MNSVLRAWIFFSWTQVAKLPMKVASEITQDNGNEPETNLENYSSVQSYLIHPSS